MNYQEWEKAVPEAITGDPLWRMKSYKLSLFLADLAWEDCSGLFRDQRVRSIADQLIRAVGSIGANIAEGYSRSSGRDQARFYEYALGSTRESQDWYYKCRHVLPTQVVEHRLKVLTEVKKMLLKIVVSQRGRKLRESSGDYIKGFETHVLRQSDHEDFQDDFLTHVPMPGHFDKENPQSAIRNN